MQIMDINKIHDLSDNKIKEQIIEIMVRFDEPKRYKPNRYDNWIKNTSALIEAIKEFEAKAPSIEGAKKSKSDICNSDYSLKDIFCIAEEQFSALSSFKSVDFPRRNQLTT